MGGASGVQGTGSVGSSRGGAAIRVRAGGGLSLAGLSGAGGSSADGKAVPCPVTGEGPASLARGLPVHLVPTSQVNLPSPK